jgi:hypothetical protein
VKWAFAGGKMARNFFVMALAVSIVLLAAGASAQVNDVSAGLGRTFISDQGVQGTNLIDSNIHFGDGFSYSLSYGRRLVDIGIASLTVEVPFVHDPTVGLNYGNNVVPKDFSAFYLTPSVRVNAFPHFAVSPWISGGGGFAHFSPSSHLEYGGASAGKSSTTGAIQLGAGLDVTLIGPIKLRGELRDFYTGEPDFNLKPQKHMHNLFAGAGLVLNF